MSSSTQIVARQLDLAARGVDLLSALANVTSSSNPLIRIPWEIGQWLGREKLTQHELEECMRRASGLVLANENGQTLFGDILQGVDSKPVGPLFLRESGSLGRLMARDPNMRWLISTVACLFQFHRDDRFVTHALTSFIIRSNATKPSAGYDYSVSNLLIHSPEHVQISPVVSKMVSSIWYNIINAGCDVMPLPSELMSMCSKGHHLDPEDLSIVMHTLTFQCKSKAILRTDHLLRDLMLWLLLHYDGILVVTCGGKVVYEKNFGNSARELEVAVKSSCTDAEPCEVVRGERYEILQNIAGKLEHFLSGHSFSSSDIPPQPGNRRPLYEVPQRHHRDSILYDKGVQILIKCTAQYFMRWLLEVPILPQKDFSDVGFSVLPTQVNPNEESKLNIRHILHRLPAMIHFNWGLMPTPPTMFVDKIKSTKEHLFQIDAAVVEDRPSHESVASMDELIDVISYFPVFEDFIKKIFPLCKCSYCERASISSNAENTLKHGCLRRIALEEVMVLLAHGIADGFGVDDASAVSNTGPIMAGILTVLSEFCILKRITWDSWFGLAASVCLGCPFRKSPNDDDPAFGGMAFAAIQFGNLVAIAPWLDLSRRITVERCFSLVVAKGRVGVNVTRKYSEEYEFHSVAGNFAIIETGGTEDTSAFNSRMKKSSLPPGTPTSLEKDTSVVSSDTILTSVDETFYRLMMRIKTSSHWRVIDPSDAMSSVIRRVPVRECPHGGSGTAVIANASKVYDFEELLGRWPDSIILHSSTNLSSRNEPQDQGGTIHLSSVLDTHYKENIAMALSVCTVAILRNPMSCCLSCAVKMARQTTKDPLRVGEGGSEADRYIISSDPSGTSSEGNVNVDNRMIRQRDGGARSS